MGKSGIPNSRKGNDGHSIYLWAETAKFDRFYTPRIGAVADFAKLNTLYSSLSETEVYQIQKNKLQEDFNKKLSFSNELQQFYKHLDKQRKFLENYSKTIQNGNDIPNAVQSRVLQILNEGLVGTDENPINSIGGRLRRNKKTWKIYETDEEMNELVQSVLKMYDELLHYQREGYIPERTVRLFKSKWGYILKGTGHEKNSSAKDLAKVYKKILGYNPKTYAKRKAAEAELLVTELFERDKDFRVIQSGNIVHGGEKIIEDAFITTNLKNNFNNGQILKMEIRTKKKNGGRLVETVSATTWEELSNAIERAASKNLTIHLSDEAYDLLQKSKTLAVQTKSHYGGPQSLLNNTQERNAITLKEIKADKMLLSILVQSFDNVVSLDYTAKSDVLALVMNKYLAESITNTQVANNDLYFTESGLETAEQWMNRRSKMLKFATPVDSITQLKDLNKSYRYDFYAVKKKI